MKLPSPPFLGRIRKWPLWFKCRGAVTRTSSYTSGPFQHMPKESKRRTVSSESLPLYSSSLQTHVEHARLFFTSLRINCGVGKFDPCQEDSVFFLRAKRKRGDCPEILKTLSINVASFPNVLLLWRIGPQRAFDEDIWNKTQLYHRGTSTFSPEKKHWEKTITSPPNSECPTCAARSEPGVGEKGITHPSSSKCPVWAGR